MGGRARRRARRRPRPRGRVGAPPARPRRARVHRPARPLGHPAARLPPRGLAGGARAGAAAALRARDHRGRRARPPRGGQGEPEAADRRGRAGGRRGRAPGGVGDAAVPDRRGRAGRRGDPPAPPDARPAARGDAGVDDAAAHDQPGDARLPQRARLPRDRDADPHALDAGGRARLPRPRAHEPGGVLRAAAVAAAVQAAADDVRLRALLPDRPLLPRRGAARRPPARVHPARPRDVVRGGGRRDRRGRGDAGAGVRGRGLRGAAAAVAAARLRRGDGPLRLRPARHAVRARDRGPERGRRGDRVQGVRHGGGRARPQRGRPRGAAVGARRA